jgi:HTH-type transcriptional regulator/antitoxin HipB
MESTMKQVLSLPEQLGPVLQAARKSARLSQSAVASRVRIGQSRMSAIELDPASVNLRQLLSILATLDLELVVQSKPATPAPGQEW